MGGDWNFVENHRDKSSHRVSYRSEEEKRIFSELKDIFQVEDDFPASNRLKYSWDSRHREGHRLMARLDRSYTSPSPVDSPCGDNYQIFRDCIHSDHLPVWRQLRLAVSEKRSSPYVMNAVHLKDKEVQEGVRQIWRRSSHLQFYGKIRRCVKFYKEFCIKKSAESKCEE